MKTITHSEFIKIVSGRKGAMILSIESDTAPKFRKTGCPFSEIRKVEYKRVVTGAKYQDAVRRQAVELYGEGAKGAKFKAGRLPYGTFATQDKIIVTDGKPQLRTVARNPRKPIKTEWFADGELVPKEKVSIYLTGSGFSRKQFTQAGLVGKKQVFVRNFDLANIKYVTIKGGERLKLVRG